MAKKVAFAILCLVCAGVALGIIALILSQWDADSAFNRVMKFVILFIWGWASFRLVSRNLK